MPYTHTNVVEVVYDGFEEDEGVDQTVVDIQLDDQDIREGAPAEEKPSDA